MKKAISIFIVFQLILSMAAFASAANGEYTTIDLINSSAVTSKAYLSKETAGTIQNPAYPDFFMTGNGAKAYAVSKESMDALLDDGVIKHNGISFKVNTADNQKVAIGSTSNRVKIPAGNYSKVHVLYTGSDSNYITIYRSVFSTGGTEVSINRIADEYVADLEWANVKATDNLAGMSKPKLKMQTYEITNKTYEYNQISFWIEANAPIRILAVTVESLSGDEWKPVIESKLAKLPNSITSPLFDMTIFEDVENLIAKAIASGANIEAITGIDKYNNLKNEIQKQIVAVESYDEKTDSEKIRVDINFTTSVSESSVKKDNFTVTSNGKALEFDVEAIKEEDVIKGIRIITENKLNYNDEIEIVVSKNIANGEDEKFTLMNDYEIVFKPTAPSIYIKEIKNENGKVTVTLKNNDEENAESYALTLGVYSTDNQMKESKVFSGEIEKETEIELECEFEIGNEDRIGCFLLDSFMTMNYLNCPIIK